MLHSPCPPLGFAFCRELRKSKDESGSDPWRMEKNGLQKSILNRFQCDPS